jgi:hypothetical protein
MHPLHGMMPFQIYSYHDRLFTSYSKNKYTIVKKFRQAGISTTTLLWLMWKCMFQFDIHAAVIAKSNREAAYYGKIIKNAINSMPDWLSPTLSKDSDLKKIFLDTNSSITFMGPSVYPNGETNLVFIDEPAFIPKMDSWWNSFDKTKSESCKIIAVSTPNGRGNWFERTYNDAIEELNEWNAICVNYYEHPDYQNESFVEQIKKNLGIIGWSHEILGLFD